jgi:hypothetical protein
MTSLYKSDDFTPEFFREYSKFKHGSKTQARELGRSVSNAISFEKHKGKTLVFYPAPCNNIPTASHAFQDYFLGFCAKQFMNLNIKVKTGKIARQYSYDEEYSLMTAEERLSKISDDMLHIDKSVFSPDDVLVFVDDIRITGSHEHHIKQLIKKENIQNECIFIYIAEYTGQDPTIENRLNSRSVGCLKDVNDIIRNEEFIFNTRVVKYILKSDIEHFVSFITYQSDSFRQTLYALSILNDYHINTKYKNNFEILKNLID